MLIPPMLGVASCSFPDYTFLRPDPGAGATGLAGDGSASSGAGAGGGGGSSGDTAGSPNGGAATSGTSGTGTGGDGGEGGAPDVPSKCADITGLIMPGCTCLDDATHAFIFCSTTKPFATAAAQCTFMEAHLVKIEGTLENMFVSSNANTITMPMNVQYFWIGASTQNSPGTWHWTDGEVFWTGGAMGTPAAGAYFNWRTDRPQNTATQACAYMDLEGGWQDGDCTQNRPYACEAN